MPLWTLAVIPRLLSSRMVGRAERTTTPMPVNRRRRTFGNEQVDTVGEEEWCAPSSSQLARAPGPPQTQGGMVPGVALVRFAVIVQSDMLGSGGIPSTRTSVAFNDALMFPTFVFTVARSTPPPFRLPE